MILYGMPSGWALRSQHDVKVIILPVLHQPSSNSATTTIWITTPLVNSTYSTNSVSETISIPRVLVLVVLLIGVVCHPDLVRYKLVTLIQFACRHTITDDCTVLTI